MKYIYIYIYEYLKARSRSNLKKKKILSRFYNLDFENAFDKVCHESNLYHFKYEYNLFYYILILNSNFS